jgi:hypothetical protein
MLGNIGKTEIAMLRHLAKAGQELFKDDDEYDNYLGILRALADEGWIELQVWPSPNRMAPQHRRRRFAVARITPAGRLAVSALERGDLPQRDIEDAGRLSEAP